MVNYSLFLLMAERQKFIEQKGYAPDTMIIHSTYNEYVGKELLEMKIKTSPHISKNAIVMYREIDVLLDIKIENLF